MIVIECLFCSYGKTKDTFGWPEEPDDAGANSTVASSNNNQNSQNSLDSDSNQKNVLITPLDKYVLNNYTIQ